MNEHVVENPSTLAGTRTGSGSGASHMHKGIPHLQSSTTGRFFTAETDFASLIRMSPTFNLDILSVVSRTEGKDAGGSSFLGLKRRTFHK